MQEPTGPASLPELGEGSTGGARIPREYAVWLIPFPNIQRGLWVGTQCAAPLAPEKTEEEIVSDPANPQAQPSTCIIFIIIPPLELDLTPVKIQKPQTQHESKPCFAHVGSCPRSPRGASGLNPSPGPKPAWNPAAQPHMGEPPCTWTPCFRPVLHHLLLVLEA